ncbi:hypothetical protein HYW41_01220 [Candidatus Daviesbacteria bacterium]|nr:hypothetical protein [Candidatus Daviesbacteria bacterium]
MKPERSAEISGNVGSRIGWLLFERMVVLPATDPKAHNDFLRRLRIAAFSGGMAALVLLGPRAIDYAAGFELPQYPSIPQITAQAGPEIQRPQAVAPSTERSLITTEQGPREIVIVRPGGIANFRNSNLLRLAVDFMEVTVDLTSMQQLYLVGQPLLVNDKVNRMISIVMMDSGPGISWGGNNRELVISMGKILRRLEEVAGGYPPKVENGDRLRFLLDVELSQALLEHLMFPPEILSDPGLRSQVSEATIKVLSQLINNRSPLPLRAGTINYGELAKQYSQLSK